MSTTYAITAAADGSWAVPWPAGLTAGVPSQTRVTCQIGSITSPMALVTRTFSADEVSAIDGAWAATTGYGLSGAAQRARIIELLAAYGLTVPLAVVSGVTRAFGLQRLVGTWYGPLITVRRSSDNATLDIYWGPDGWLDTAALLAFVGAGTGYVTKWWDQSGYGGHAYQTSASAQPRICTGGAIYMIGGKPALYLDGTAWMRCTIAEREQPYSVGAIVQASDWSIGTNNRLFQGASSRFWASNAFGAPCINAGSDIFGAALTDGAAYGMCGVYNGASSHLRVNSAVVTGNAGTGKRDADINLFTTGTGGTGTGIIMVGLCSDLVFVNAALDTTQSAALVTALGSGRGISA